eukprot:gene9197-16336_t
MTLAMHHAPARGVSMHCSAAPAGSSQSRGESSTSSSGLAEELFVRKREGLPFVQLDHTARRREQEVWKIIEAGEAAKRSCQEKQNGQTLV